MGLQPSDPSKSPPRPPSDQITIKTPNKFPNPRSRIKNPRSSIVLPDKYETLLRLFDALDASLKLLRLRKSAPLFSKIRVMVENISERRFTHRHLAQLKFLLPEEIGVRKLWFHDEESRCRMHDLHLTLNKCSATNPHKRKRGSRYSYIREHLTSRLFQFLRAHPQGAEIPVGELPEPFNQRKQDHLLKTIKNSSSFEHTKGGLGDRTGNTLQRSSVAQPVEMLESVTIMSRRQRSEQPATCIKQKPSADGQTCCPKVEETRSTPLKSVETPIKPGTPALQEPKMCKSSLNVDSLGQPFEAVNPPCARSLVFEGPSNVELQLDEESECLDIIDILPESVLQLLKEKEEKKAAEAKRKQKIVQLPKLFDRIHFLFQGPKYSAVRKEVLIRDLTERHSDITDESEVEEQFKILQEIIPEWIVCRFSPSGNMLYSINRALKPDSLRLRLDRAV